VLSGDNVVVIGMAAAGLAAELRSRAILIGIVAATVIRISFAVIATQLLAITGLLLAGGLLLRWVCWKMFRELQGAEAGPAPELEVATNRRGKALGSAVWQIIIADVSMSLDNVLAVAGAARQDITALVFGLTLSVVLMGLASALVAALLSRFRWIAWIGLAIIVYVAVTMIYQGTDDLVGHSLPVLPFLES
jgi:YjbE family integral membrane protein